MCEWSVTGHLVFVLQKDLQFIYYNSSIDLILLITHHWNLRSTGMTLKLNQVYNSWTNSSQYFYWCRKGKSPYHGVQAVAGTANIGNQRNMTASFLVQDGAQQQQCTMLHPYFSEFLIFAITAVAPLPHCRHRHGLAPSRTPNSAFKGMCACTVWLRHTWQTPCEHTPA